MKNKEEFTVRLDTDLYKKLLYVSEKETGGLNSHILHMVRQNIAYYEKVHGRINTAEIKLPDSPAEKEEKAEQ